MHTILSGFGSRACAISRPASPDNESSRDFFLCSCFAQNSEVAFRRVQSFRPLPLGPNPRTITPSPTRVELRLAFGASRCHNKRYWQGASQARILSNLPKRLETIHESTTPLASHDRQRRSGPRDSSIANTGPPVPEFQWIFLMYSGYKVSGLPVAAARGTPYFFVISSTKGFFSGS